MGIGRGAQLGMQATSSPLGPFCPSCNPPPGLRIPCPPAIPPGAPSGCSLTLLSPHPTPSPTSTTLGLVVEKAQLPACLGVS